MMSSIFLSRDAFRFDAWNPRSTSAAPIATSEGAIPAAFDEEEESAAPRSTASTATSKRDDEGSIADDAIEAGAAETEPAWGPAAMAPYPGAPACETGETGADEVEATDDEVEAADHEAGLADDEAGVADTEVAIDDDADGVAAHVTGNATACSVIALLP